MTGVVETAAAPQTAVRFRRAVLGTCCVPWTDDERFDEPRFRRTVRALNRRGLTDLYIFGTAGEGHAVSDRQFAEIAAVFVDELRDVDATPMVGVIALSTRTVIERIEHAAALGVRELQLSLPNWGSLNDRELRRFFDETCGRFRDLSFLHYNLRRAGRLITPVEYAELAERHPNLVATKYGAGDPETIAGLFERAPMLRHYFTELGFFIGAPLGPCGLLASIASANPQRARAYLDAGAAGDWPAFTALYRELAAMMVALRAAVGSGPYTDGAYDKIVSRLADPTFPARLLGPYEPAPDDAFARYRDILQQRFPAWLPPEEGS
jgi:dihydrodipicolinate synthase/N-acetylneuraminate lyase